MRAGAKAAFSLAIALAVGCDPIVAPSGRAAPMNSCPEHPCQAYTQDGTAPTCNAGVCTVPAATAGLLLVIELPDDAYQAPSRTYLMTFADQPPSTDPCAPPPCDDATSCSLKQWASDQASYLLDLNASSRSEANWYLGNPKLTALPVTATYRPLLPGFPPQDAIDLGLPLEPVPAVNARNASQVGPNGTEALEFQAYMQPGCYERTLQPFAPFSQAFPPEIKPWTGTSAMTTPQELAISDFDVTTETSETGIATSPIFQIARPEGLDGWTAYLRDIDTKRVFSNVAPLSGSLATNVTLLTNHVLIQGGEALSNLELVIAPPAGSPIPTEFLAPSGPPGAQVLPAREAYPSLPIPVTVSGRIRTAAGDPVAAAVIFTATDITDRSGRRFPPNFEFSRTVVTVRDPRTGASTYTALLPQGDYQVAVHPTDATNALTVVSRTVGGQGSAMTDQDIDVAPLVAVTGTAIVADGRALAEAVVEARPTQCASTPGVASVTVAPGAANPCLPDGDQTATANDGSFSLSLGPGVYMLRIRPAQGTRLPWVEQTITVGSTRLPVGIVKIPAPMSVGLTITDSVSMGNAPIPNAIVRVFTTPTVGNPPVELGVAMTDEDGVYEMYLAPPSQ
jgi:hypothetical protein